MAKMSAEARAVADRRPKAVRDGLGQRVAALDWAQIEESLDARGYAVAASLLSAAECRALAGLYDQAEHFRSTVTMARHGFGRGEYRYFGYPLPDDIALLRRELYPRLAPCANRWNERMGIADRYPAEHRDFLARCRAAGQTR